MRRRTSMSLEEMILKDIEETARRKQLSGICTNKSREMEKAWKFYKKYQKNVII